MSIITDHLHIDCGLKKVSSRGGNKPISWFAIFHEDLAVNVRYISFWDVLSRAEKLGFKLMKRVCQRSLDLDLDFNTQEGGVPKTQHFKINKNQ